MFYQQDQIEKNLQCKICHEILRAPKLLSCGEAVCEECILNFLRIQVNPNQEFKCPVCKDIHDIPRNRKFPGIKSIESILQQRPNQIVPCKLVKKFHQDLDENQNMLMDLKEFVHNGGTDKVQEYCQELRGDVHLATQIRIVEIHEQGDKLIKQIDAFQEKISKEMEGEISKTNSLIGHMEKFNSIWRNNLKKFNKEESEIEDALRRLLSIHKQADLALYDLNNFVRKYKKCKFNLNEKKMGKNFIGSLSMEDQEMNEEDEENDDEDSVSKCSLDYSGIQDWSDIWIAQIMEISDVHDVELIKERLLENDNDVEETILELLERKKED